jgi:tetratricopeptide (TPR) repeat protein
MDLCRVCYSELIQFKGKLICSNDSCDFIMLAEEVKKSNLPWFRSLVEDPSLWEPAIFNEYPSIVAHEYWRLYSLLVEGQTYGAFLQLKDVFEVALKFPILLAVSEMYKKSDRGEMENKVLAFLQSKALGLGDWEEITRQITKIKTVNSTLRIWLEKIYKLFRDNKITKWRNENIGHGALFFDHKDGFKEDMKGKINLLKGHFEEVHEYYLKTKLYMVRGEEKEYLIGKEKASNIKSGKCELYAEIDNSNFILFPYILIDKEGLYFFDSYFSKKNKTAILNYPDGTKNELNKQVHFTLFKLYNSLKHYSNSREENSSVDDETYSKIESDLLHQLEEIDDFQSPKKLETWIRGAVNKHNKGLFLLQMERGTGKTTFCRALDELSIHKIKLDGVSVRSYYINDSYRYNINTFSTKVNELLQQNENGEQEFEGIHGMDQNEKNKKKAFASLLRKYQKAHERHFHKEKILFIIDGMDEIPSGQESSIFDFIPNEVDLPKNVYILLTCRTNLELAPFTQSRMKLISPTENKVYSLDDGVSTLKEYIKRKILKINGEKTKLSDTQENIIDSLIKHADKRFIYLKPLKEIVRANPDLDVSSLPTGETILPYYLESLQHLYGDKFFKRVKRILGILSSGYEGLTFREISYLFGENRPSFQFLAHLIDIRSFLLIERHPRGNIISISHQEYQSYIMQHFKDEIRELVDQWACGCLDESFNLEIQNSGELYLFTYLYKYVEDFTPENLDQLCNPAIVERLLTYAKKVNRFLYDQYQQHYNERLIKLLGYLQRMNKKEGNNLYPFILTQLLAFRGQIFAEREDIYHAITDLMDALDIIDGFESIDEHQLLEKSSILGNIGYCYMKEELYQKAHFYNSKAYELVTQIKEINNDMFSNYYKILNAIGLNLKYLKMYPESIHMFTILYEVGEECGGDIEMLTIPLRNRASVYMEMGDYDKSINDLDKVIEIREDLGVGKNIKHRELLANAYSGRATVFAMKEEYVKSTQDNNQSIAMRELLYEAGNLKNPLLLANDYYNRGANYIKEGNPKSAYQDFSRSIGIAETLLVQNRYFSNKELMELVYTYIARADIEMDNNLEIDLIDLNKGLKILELLDESNLVYLELKEKIHEKLGGRLIETDPKMSLNHFLESEKIWIQIRRKNNQTDPNRYLKVLYVIAGVKLTLKDYQSSVNYLLKLMKQISIHSKKYPDIFPKYKDLLFSLCKIVGNLSDRPTDMEKLRRAMVNLFKHFSKANNLKFVRDGSKIGVLSEDDPLYQNVYKKG